VLERLGRSIAEHTQDVKGDKEGIRAEVAVDEFGVTPRERARI
jgi:hypothetical protein